MSPESCSFHWPTTHRVLRDILCLIYELEILPLIWSRLWFLSRCMVASDHLCCSCMHQDGLHHLSSFFCILLINFLPDQYMLALLARDLVEYFFSLLIFRPSILLILRPSVCPLFYRPDQHYVILKSLLLSTCPALQLNAER